MVGVRRLDARHKQAATSVAQSEGGSLQGVAAAPAALTPVRPYHVSASQLVRPGYCMRLGCACSGLCVHACMCAACVYATSSRWLCCAEDAASAIAVSVGHDKAVRAGHLAWQQRLNACSQGMRRLQQHFSSCLQTAHRGE